MLYDDQQHFTNGRQFHDHPSPLRRTGRLCPAGHGQRLCAERGRVAQQDGAHHRALPARRQLGHHCAIHQPGAVGIAQAKRDRGKQGRRQRQPGRRPGGQGRARWLHAAAVRRGRIGHQPVGVHQTVVRPVQRPAWRDHAGLLAPPAGGAPLGAGEQPQGTGRLLQEERPELCRDGHRQRTAPGRRGT